MQCLHGQSGRQCYEPFDAISSAFFMFNWINYPSLDLWISFFLFVSIYPIDIIVWAGSGDLGLPDLRMANEWK